MGTVHQIDQDTSNRLRQAGGNLPPIDTYFDKYIDARINSIDGKLDAHLSSIDNRFHRIEEDIREIRTEVKGIKYWVIGTALAIIGIFIGLFTYHAQVMQMQMSGFQSQMQVYSEYIKSLSPAHPLKDSTTSK